MRRFSFDCRHGGIRSAAAVVAVVLALSGCGASAQELADQRAKEREARIEALDEAPVWIGTITGYAGYFKDQVSVDYGGKYEADVKLSYVDSVESFGMGQDCTYELGDTGLDRFVAALHKAAPIGSEIAVIRSRADRNGGVLLPITLKGKPDKSKASVNERMAAAGVAIADPYAKDPQSKDDHEVFAAQKEDLNHDDFIWWARVVAAGAHASSAGTGLVGQCARAIKAEKAAEAKARAKEDAEFRRWERGPDGRKGTKDDYTYGDKRDDGSGGGGSINVPGWLCPTRWC